MMGRLQFWLQGVPGPPDWQIRHRPWAAVALGNAISDVRYWTWRAWIFLRPENERG